MRALSIASRSTRSHEFEHENTLGALNCARQPAHPPKDRLDMQEFGFAMMALALAKLTVHQANADTEDAILYARTRVYGGVGSRV